MKYEDMAPEQQLAVRNGGPIPVVATLNGKKIFESVPADDGGDKVVFDEVEDDT